MKKPDEKGVSAVEFALLLPLLVLIIFVIIEGGLVLYNQQVITNASREGAREGILFNPSARPTEPEIKKVVSDYTKDYLITFKSGTEAITEVPTGVCTNLGNDLTVKVSYQYSFLILDNFGFAGPNLTATTTMRCE
jgi:Flp pilus assembly protein TadG